VIDPSTPLVLLVSKCDSFTKLERPAVVDELDEYARTLGFSPEVVLSAAFSKDPERIVHGYGVFAALQKVLAHAHVPRKRSAAERGERAFFNFSYGRV
jgi:hypothetical protein